MQIPWQAGKCMTLNVTVTDTLAESYIPAYHIFIRRRCRRGRGQPEGTQVYQSLSNIRTLSFRWRLKRSVQ